jgi:hypothetical protein
MKPTFFILGKANDPWGDYGDSLMHGDAGRSADGALQLQRAAPFVPSISFPGLPGIIVTDRFRHDLEESPLQGITFESIEKHRIVNIAWHDGSRNTDEPPEYPETGEPEDYILGQPHDPRLAEQIGDLWELVPPKMCYTTRKTRIVTSRDEITLVTGDWSGSDLFMADGVLYYYITTRARDWFTARVPELLVFHNAVASSTPPPDQLPG